MTVILKVWFQTHYTKQWLGCLLWNCSWVNATEPHQWEVTIGSVNGVVSSGTAITPAKVDTDLCRHMLSLVHNELIFIRHQAIPWTSVDLSSVGFVAFSWEQFSRKYSLRHMYDENYIFRITSTSPRRQWVKQVTAATLDTCIYVLFTSMRTNNYQASTTIF